MIPITIHSPYTQGFTVVSNRFIDHYMPSANGEFVKIYLYLLRTISSESHSFLLSNAADILNCTDNDVLRALRFWEKAGLLSLNFNESNHLTQIHLLFASETAQQDSVLPVSAPADAVHEIAIASPKEEEEKKPKRITLSASKVKKLKENSELSELLFITQQYMGKPLTPSETERILYFYEELHFSADLIEYLIEYCISKGSTSIHYIEKVALAWHKDKITTVEMAKETSNLYNKQYFTILKALGIKNRNPIEPEIQLMNTWLYSYGFGLDIISEACTRTIRQTNQPSFQYVDGILKRWSKYGIKHLSDLDAIDLEHKKASKESAERRQERAQSQASSTSAPNAFNNFDQRTYDLDALERKLLNQQP